METFIVISLVFAQGMCSMAEAALLSVRKNRLKSEVEKGSTSAKKILDLAEEPDAFLSALQFSHTTLMFVALAYGLEVFREPLQDYFQTLSAELEPYSAYLSWTLMVLGLIFLSLLFGQALPRRIGEAAPERVAKFLIPAMGWLMLLIRPLTWIFEWITKLLLKIMRVDTSANNQVTEEEIHALLQEGAETGLMDEIEQDIVKRVFHLGEVRISSLMTHRSDLIWIDVRRSFAENMEKIRSEHHSVYPVCDGSMDEILGLVHLKELYLSDIHDFNLEALKPILQEPLIIPDTLDAYTVLEDFKTHRKHQGIIVDEYGIVVGMLTLNDILEALVGDISDAPEQEYQIVQRDEQSYLVDAQYSFYDFINYFELEYGDFSDEHFKTLAGFILHQLRHIPKTGERLQWREFEFEIVDMDAKKIDKVMVTRRSEV